MHRDKIGAYQCYLASYSGPPFLRARVRGYSATMRVNVGIMLTHRDIWECIGAAMRVNGIEVWPSQVHTPNYESGSNMSMIPGQGSVNNVLHSITSLVYYITGIR